MKIKSIKKMKNIGLLNETAYTNCDLFLYHNKIDNQDKCYWKSLIKGNNGTGKTTFSSILYSIEKNDCDILERLRKIDGTDNINIEIELENGNIIRYDTIKKQWINTEDIVVRVFNEDYIKDNINFEEFDKTNKINGKYETQELKLSIGKNNFENSKNALEENKKQQKAIKQELEKEKTDFNTRISTEYDAYCKLDINFDKLEERVNSVIEIIDKKLNDMQNAIDTEKLKKLDSYLTYLNIEIEELKKINQQATDINEKMSSAKKQLTELRKEIKDLKVKQFVSNNLEKINNLLNLKKSETLLFQQFKEADKLYKKKLLDSDVVTKEINDWLKSFGLDKYVIDNKFNLNYANTVINNKTFILSTGELSIITFAYFLTTLVTELTDDEKDKLVIVIDDPVNSIDYNKIYSFATAIKNIQSKIRKNNPPQLFVLTHNILLYNILVQSNFWKNKNAGIFELYKDNNSLSIKKDIHTKDTIFINYLKKVINVTRSERNDVEIENVVIYNCIRTVLENFKYLLNPEYSETIKDFFELIDEEYSKLDYIINHNSHNEPELSCEPWFDEELLKNCCIVISDMVKKKYSKLYDYCMKKWWGGNKQEAVYCATKWGERGYIESLKACYKGTSVKVIGVYPGGINTEFYKNSRDYVSEEKQFTFMKPYDVAKTIIDNVTNETNLTVEDIIIERN